MAAAFSNGQSVVELTNSAAVEVVASQGSSDAFNMAIRAQVAAGGRQGGRQGPGQETQDLRFHILTVELKPGYGVNVPYHGMASFSYQMKPVVPEPEFRAEIAAPTVAVFSGGAGQVALEQAGSLEVYDADSGEHQSAGTHIRFYSGPNVICSNQVFVEGCEKSRPSQARKPNASASSCGPCEDKVYLSNNSGANDCEAGSSQDVQWSIVGDSRGCRLEEEEDTENAWLYFEAEQPVKEGYVTVRATVDEESSDVAVWVGGGQCSECEPGAVQYTVGSIAARFNLGRRADGSSLGALNLAASEMTPAAATPACLNLLADWNEMDVVRDPAGGWVRQVKTPQAFFDIVTNSAFSYEIRVYPPEAVTGKWLGLYLLSGPPMRVNRVSNPDGASAARRLRIEEIRGATTNSSEFAWDETTGAWSLSRAGGLRSESVENETYQEGGVNYRVETRTVSDGQSNVASRTRTKFRQFSWGEAIVEQVQDPEGAALTARHEYYDGDWRQGKVRLTVNADGSWTSYDYDGEQRLISVVSGWKDTPADSPPSSARYTAYAYWPVDWRDDLSESPRSARIEFEYIQGVCVGLTYRAFFRPNPYEYVEIVERAAAPDAWYGDPRNQRTTTTYHTENVAGPANCQLKSILHPDGRLDSYSYETGEYYDYWPDYPEASYFMPGPGPARRITVTHGTASNPGGIPGKTTQETTVLLNGRTVLSETHAYVTWGWFERTDWTVTRYDASGRPIAVWQSDGTLSESTWGCCGKEYEKDGQGIEHSYIYDALGRVAIRIKHGTSAGPWPAQPDQYTLFNYDAEGRQLSVTRSGGGISMTSSNSYDIAGRLIKSVDESGLVTENAYADGGRIVTVTQPGGATQITENYLDGQTRSVTGTAGAPTWHDYGVNEDGTRWEIVYTGPAGAASPNWEKTTTDFLGRPIRIERPAFGGGTNVQENFYNSAGRLVKTTQTSRPDTLYEYDSLGNQTRSGQDINANGTLDLTSMDRISESDTFYQFDWLDTWQVTASIIYPFDNSAVPVTTSTQRRKLTGLSASQSSYTISLDILGNATVQTTAGVRKILCTKGRKGHEKEQDHGTSEQGRGGRLLAGEAGPFPRPLG